VLVAVGLPRAPSGKVYVVWLVGRAAVTAAGVLDVTPAGDAVRRLPPASQAVEDIRVTLEPATGVAVPRGPTVLASR
jgi:hypothetical protein